MYLPLPMAIGWMFFALSIIYFVFANYSVRRRYPSEIEFAVPVVANLGAYVFAAALLICLAPGFVIELALGIVAGTLGTLAASQWHPDEEMTTIHLVLGMFATLLLFGLFWGIVSFTLNQPMQSSAPLVITISLTMFLGTVFGDWLVSDHGTVGYFGGTDAVFYAFAITSFFIVGGFFDWSGGILPTMFK